MSAPDARGDLPDGWRALAAHVAAVDGGEPAALIPIARPGSVAAVSVHRLEAPSHWHLVTYGLSTPEPPVPGPEGWGFELTLRLARAEDDDLPTWAVNLLANLGAYVLSSGHPFAVGHHIDLRGPIRLGSDSAITAAAIALDPVLGTAEAPSGPVELLQVVGLTADELELCRAWRTGAVLDLLRRADRLLVTRLERTSLLDDPVMREEAQAGVAAAGSALADLRVGTLTWQVRGRRGQRARLSLGSGAATGLGPALRRQLNRSGASFELIGDIQRVRFEVADRPAWSPRVTTLAVSVPRARVDELASLFTGRTGSGGLPWLAGLRIVVVP